MGAERANPFRAGLRAERVIEPCAIVIFGASGDLTKRKLVPALYGVAADGLLPPATAIVGFSRTPKTDDQYRAELCEGVRAFARAPFDETTWQRFASGVYYQAGDFGKPESFAALGERLRKLDEERGLRGSRLFYLAVPPLEFGPLMTAIGAAGFASARGPSPFARVIVEKPFGTDLASGRALNETVRSVLQERQVFRIDHYLGKETVQNILVFRFANGIFEPVWNQKYVDHVQITMSEDIGVEGRGRFYEEAGALRDVIQNHVMQLLCLVAMEPPVALDADAVRDEKVKVLRAVRPLSGADVAVSAVRGQYGRGFVAGQEVPAYREEPGASPQSSAETFAALRLHLDNWRWAGVPFYLRSGKRLGRRVTEIAIQFKAVPHALFRVTDAPRLEPNLLVLRIQPDEGITLRFGSKVPGALVRVRTVNMDFRYGASFGSQGSSAYERLLLDALVGDPTLFTRSDEVEAAWAIVDPVLEAWREPPADFPNYESGTSGPTAADELLARDGRAWRRI